MSNTMTKPWHFDKRDIVDEVIGPKLKEVAELCKQHNVPFIAMLQSASTEKEDDISHSLVVRHSRTGYIMDISERIIAMMSFLSHDELKDMPENVAALFEAAHDFRIHTIQPEFRNDG